MPRYSYQIWLLTPDGARLGLASDFLRASYSLDAREGGGFSLELPHNFDQTLLLEGGQVEVWQSVDGRAPTWEETFIITHRPWAQGRRGTQFKTVSGPSLTQYLTGKNSRVIAYLFGSSGSVTDAADDVVKYFVRQTLTAPATGSGSDTGGRDVSSVYGLTVDAPLGQAALITVDGFCKPLSDVIGEARKKSEEDLYNPRRLFWRCLLNGVNPARYRFATFLDLVGVNHGRASPQPVYIAPEFGTAGEVEWDRDRTDEYNSVYIRYNSGAGQGRLTDTSRTRQYAGAFREAFVDVSSEATAGAAQIAARRKLAEGRARNVMRVNVMDTDSVRYGVDYRFGDRVAVRFMGELFDMDVTGVNVDVGRDGVKRTIKLEEVG